MEKLQPFLSVSGNAKWCSHYGKWYGGFQKNRTTILQQSHFWIYIKKTGSQDLKGILALP